MSSSINTNQNVTLELNVSSIADRIIAYVIDSLVIAGVSLILGFLILMISSGKPNLQLFLLLGLFGFLYHFLCEVFMDGQSFGKRARGIKVIRTDGRNAGITGYFLRFVLRPIDSIYGLGLAFIFFTDKGQRLGDLAAGTMVVNVTEKVGLSTIRNEMYSPDLENREIKYPTVNLLQDKDIQLINKVLDKHKASPRHQNVEMLADKVSQRLDVTYDTAPFIFLREVVLDYQATFIGESETFYS